MRRRDHLAVFGACAVLFAACAPTARAESPVSDPNLAAAPDASAPPQDESMPSTPWSMTYHDGSANGFRVWQDEADGEVRFETTPVTPEHSSSGVYSGGEPRQGTLTVPVVLALWQHLRRLQEDTGQHASSRMMGTGAFALQVPGGETTFIVGRGEGLAEFDAFLATLVGP